MQETEYLISIITVVFNGAATLEETILSVLDQDYQPLEYIIIDGGSTDGTIDIIRKYEDRITYWVSERDNGIYDAMNKGKKIAKGNWCLFLGADDILTKDILQQVSGTFKDGDVVYYGNIIVKGSEKRYDGYFSKYKLCRRNICHQSVFYPQAAYKQLDFNLKYRLWADWVYNLTLKGKMRVPFKYIEADIAVFHDGGVGSISVDKQFVKDRMAIIRQNFGFTLSFWVWFSECLSKIKSSFKSK